MTWIFCLLCNFLLIGAPLKGSHFLVMWRTQSLSLTSAKFETKKYFVEPVSRFWKSDQQVHQADRPTVTPDGVQRRTEKGRGQPTQQSLIQLEANLCFFISEIDEMLQTSPMSPLCYVLACCRYVVVQCGCFLTKGPVLKKKQQLFYHLSRLYVTKNMHL